VRALITPHMPDGPDPSDTVHDGYACMVVKANHFFFGSVGTSLPVKTNRVVWTNGGQDWSGFMITTVFSPDDDTIEVDVVNNPGVYSGDADNTFQDHIVRLLWGT
jgi:hypothetical protein